MPKPSSAADEQEDQSNLGILSAIATHLGRAGNNALASTHQHREGAASLAQPGDVAPVSQPPVPSRQSRRKQQSAKQQPSTGTAEHAGLPSNEDGVLAGLGGAGVGAEPTQGMEETMAPAHGAFDTTPLIPNVSLPSISAVDHYVTSTPADDFGFFAASANSSLGSNLANLSDNLGTSRSADNMGNPSGLSMEMAVDELLTDEQKMETLRKLDRDAEMAISANAQYTTNLLKVLEVLVQASTRMEELELLANNMHSSLLAGTELKVFAPGAVNVTLPWFKHFHNKDLPPNADGQARDAYLNAIRHVPWTGPEREQLRKEIVTHNKQNIALAAHSNGENIEKKLAEYDENYYVEVTEHLDWEKIALVIARRSALECKIQWLQHDHPRINKSKWQSEELEKMFVIAEEKGLRDWQGIADELATSRTAAECLRQFRRRTGQRRNWSKEEDDLLREGVRLYGENWQSVARLVGRHSNQCINRWSKTLHPTIRRGKWTVEEDDSLRAAVKSCGPNWKQVAPRVRGRTDAQCRERWVNILDPRILPPRIWDPEEEAKLVQLREVNQLSWSEIAHEFEDRRTDNHCLRHYNEILKRRSGKGTKGKKNTKASIAKGDKTPGKRGRPPKVKAAVEDATMPNNGAADPMNSQIDQVISQELESLQSDAAVENGASDIVVDTHVEQGSNVGAGTMLNDGKDRKGSRKRSALVANLDPALRNVVGTESSS